jgi:hypothetical protein
MSTTEKVLWFILAAMLVFFFRDYHQDNRIVMHFDNECKIIERTVDMTTRLCYDSKNDLEFEMKDRTVH